MTTALEHIRYACGIAGEEVAAYVDELELRVSSDTDLIESLRQQLAEKDAKIAQLRLARDMLYSEGCEKDAQIEQLLEYPYANEALESLIAKAGEVMRERCLSEIDPKYYSHELAKHIVEGCCNDLRALPGVTLEDLK